MESQYGIVTREFVVSDAYDTLFDDPTAVMISGVDIDSTKHDIELSTGVQAEDELQLVLDEAFLRMQDDLDAAEFIKQAQDPGEQRFCALFIQPEYPVKTTASLEFSGAILPSQGAEDLRWYGPQFSDTPTPLRRWKLTVKSFDVNVFDQAKLEDLIRNQEDGVDNGLTDGLTKQTGWNTSDIANDAAPVADRLGYFKWFKDGLWREVRFAELANLNAVLRGLADVLQERLRISLNVPSYTIVIDDAIIDGRFTPARFRHVLATDQDNSNIAYRTRYCGWDGDQLIGGAFKSTNFYKVFPDDGVTLKLGDTATAGESPWIHWRMVNPPAAARGLSFLRAKTFADLLYMIAASFGLFVRFYYTDSTTMHIQFISRQSLVRERVYIPGVTKASLKVSPFAASAQNPEVSPGQSCAFALEGDDVYEQVTNDIRKPGYFMPSSRMQTQQTGDRLLFTLSPTVRRQSRGEDDSSEVQPGFYLPHNAFFYDGGHRKTHPKNDDETYRAIDPDDRHIHTGIYVRCTGIQDVEDTRIGWGTDGLTVYLPATAVTVTDPDGVGREFRTMSGYVNFLRGVQGDAFNNEYELTVPFLCRFRRSQDGSHADDDGGRGRWQNLQIGSVIGVDGVDYVTFGIERKHRQHETNIRLHAVTAYSFSDSVGLQAPVDGGAPPTAVFLGSTYEPTTSVVDRTWLALEEIRQGDAVVMAADASVRRATAFQSSHALVIGIALNDAPEGGLVRIGRGTVTCQNWSFPDTGLPVYVRTAVLPDVNLSVFPLTEPNVGENTFICVGTAVATATLEFEIKHDFVYEQFLQ